MPRCDATTHVSDAVPFAFLRAAGQACPPALVPAKGGPMDVTVHWSEKPGPAPHVADLDHGLWWVSVPDRASGAVELAYVGRSPDG